MKDLPPCPSGKRVLPNRKAAMRAAADVSRLTFGNYHHYQCRQCGHWHIGHRTRHQRRVQR